MSKLWRYNNWKYFLVNYERGFVPNSGTHGLFVLRYMNLLFNKNDEYKLKYPDVYSNLEKCNNIIDKYLDNSNYIKSSEDIKILKKTTKDLYSIAPSHYKLAVKLDEINYDVKSKLGYKTCNKTFIDKTFDKYF
jgi:hypothetical protein